MLHVRGTSTPTEVPQGVVEELPCPRWVTVAATVHESRAEVHQCGTHPQVRVGVRRIGVKSMLPQRNNRLHRRRRIGSAAEQNKAPSAVRSGGGGHRRTAHAVALLGSQSRGPLEQEQRTSHIVLLEKHATSSDEALAFQRGIARANASFLHSAVRLARCSVLA